MGIHLNEEQQAALKILQSGANVFLTGKAGVGKSTLLRQYIKSCKKNVLVCAPTGIAALNVGGMTLHRCFGISPGPKGRFDPSNDAVHPSKALLNAEVLIIDEISMCRFDLFAYVCRYLKMINRHPQIILVGDFFQLPPVLNKEEKNILKRLWNLDDVGEGFAFISERWDELDLRVINLRQVMRQTDNEFIDILNAIRSGRADAGIISRLQNISQYNITNNQDMLRRAIRIVPRKKEAEAINARELSAIDDMLYTFRGTSGGEFAPSDAPVDEVFSIKVGARVMSVVNDRQKQYVNGSMGTVLGINQNEKIITVHFDNGTVASVGINIWKKQRYEVDEDNGILREYEVGWFAQFPLRLAYAITIHKSQGQTYDAAIISPRMFANGQLYVALSRCRSKDAIYIDGELKPDDLKVSHEVCAFYNAMDTPLFEEKTYQDETMKQTTTTDETPIVFPVELEFQGKEFNFLMQYAVSDGLTASEFSKRIILDYMRNRYRFDHAVAGTEEQRPVENRMSGEKCTLFSIPFSRQGEDTYA